MDVTIDAKSVNTGYALFNSHLQGADFFDTEKFPTITFKSTQVKFDGDKPVAAVAGEPFPEPAADGARERLLALALLGLSAVTVWAIVTRLG